MDIITVEFLPGYHTRLFERHLVHRLLERKHGKLSDGEV
jgi:hypothetical protein